ncbi:MAG: hypothetical protein K2Y56_15960 [Methylobacterium sp.]|uniref:hypothetical protein n=1 Tax=Methylobacterium sp. TaxID=409 RepID=UPI0025E95472|nr:hypothetical protein [Methylobacterium sp.]MBX9933010.1 hypothetical protein [Methylobacterium sp.]
MILDRVDYTDGYAADRPTVIALNVEYVGIKRNGAGIMCFAFMAPGKRRATLLEVGFVQRIEVGERCFVAPPYATWAKRAAELKAFIARASSRQPAKPRSRAARPAEPQRPWWQRLLG